VVGGESRKIRDDAWLATPSPDGSKIAYISPDYRELWLMNSYGQDALRLQAIPGGATFLQAAWSPDGRRLAYLKNYSLSLERVIESCDLSGRDVHSVWSDRRIKNFTWTPRGSIIATLTEMNSDPSAGPARSDLWEIGVRNGQASGKPARLTNFAGFTPLSLSITADGKRLALIRNYDQSDVYVGALEARGARMQEPRRLTLDERIDWPGGWTRDSRSVLFYSDRQGAFDIFQQRLEDRMAQTLSLGPEEKRQPQLSPDGAWILYLAWPAGAGNSPPKAGSLMRMAVTGGPAQAVFAVPGYPGSAREASELGTHVLTTNGYPDFRCPVSRSSLCVISEGGGAQVTFTAFDPVRGKQNAVGRAEVAGPSVWDLAPDGSRIAIAEFNRADRIRILSVPGAGTEVLAVTGFRQIASVGWSADGGALFVTGTAPEGGTVLRQISASGESHLLYKTDAWLERPLASPDGRMVAFGQATSSNNVWTIENFEPR